MVTLRRARLAIRFCIDTSGIIVRAIWIARP